MGITKTYTCSDGKIFKDEDSAERHENNLDKQYAEQATKWLIATDAGKDLIKKHSLDEEGVWWIYGEDPTAFGFPPSSPLLGTVNGMLQDVIKTAVMLDKFYTWGQGGTIVKAKFKNV
jgi:hypothetical protein